MQHAKIVEQNEHRRFLGWNAGSFVKGNTVEMDRRGMHSIGKRVKPFLMRAGKLPQGDIRQKRVAFR